jgi:hypothetical protein
MKFVSCWRTASANYRKSPGRNVRFYPSAKTGPENAQWEYRAPARTSDTSGSCSHRPAGLGSGTGPPRSSPFERQQVRKPGQDAASSIYPEMHAWELKGSARGAAACALEADGQTDLIIHAVIGMPALPGVEGGGGSSVGGRLPDSPLSS